MGIELHSIHVHCFHRLYDTKWKRKILVGRRSSWTTVYASFKITGMGDFNSCIARYSRTTYPKIIRSSTDPF